MKTIFQFRKAIELITVALAASLAMVGAVSAEDNIFSGQELPAGYLVADANMNMDGKSGTMMCKNMDGMMNNMNGMMSNMDGMMSNMDGMMGNMNGMMNQDMDGMMSNMGDMRKHMDGMRQSMDTMRSHMQAMNTSMAMCKEAMRKDM